MLDPFVKLYDASTIFVESVTWKHVEHIQM